jgi:hypothetical protein
MNETGMFSAPVLFVPSITDPVLCQICFQDVNIILCSKSLRTINKYTRKPF